MRCFGNDLSKQPVRICAHPVYGAFGCACEERTDTPA